MSIMARPVLENAQCIMDLPPMTDAPAPIRSRGNPVFGRFRRLKEKGGPDLCLVEGPKLLEEALASGVEVVEVVVTERSRASERGARLTESLLARGVPVRRMDEDLVATLSETETSQGLVALVRRPGFVEDALYRGVPLIVVAVGLQDPGNLGGVLRSAEAAGATGAYLTAGTADPFSWKALRGSMGSAFRLPHVRGLPAEEALRRLRARGVFVLATAADGDVPYDRVDLRRPVALLLGREGAGLPEAIVAQADERLAIPMGGGVESLNVGVAAGVVLFEAARQRR
jgi:RNA methyltransferase, TrmH family